MINNEKNKSLLHNCIIFNLIINNYFIDIIIKLIFLL